MMARRWWGAALSGLLAGMFGIGGGAILVPIFFHVFGLLGLRLVEPIRVEEIHNVGRSTAAQVIGFDALAKDHVVT